MATPIPVRSAAYLACRCAAPTVRQLFHLGRVVHSLSLSYSIRGRGACHPERRRREGTAFTRRDDFDLLNQRSSSSSTLATMRDSSRAILVWPCPPRVRRPASLMISSNTPG